MKKKLLVAAVIGAVAAPGVSQAAIDDAGMKYISASEGLQGSVRIKLFSDNDGENVGPETAYSSSRLIYNGEADLGGGLAATYLFEFRPGGGNGSTVNTENVDAGLRGPFGWIRAGRVESTSSAILPSADLTADSGTSGEKLAGDYDNGIRWTSPDINGLTLGMSAQMQDDPDVDDDAVDRFDLSAAYALPQGISIGGSYAKVSATPALDTEPNYGDTDGFRLGVKYGQDNWSVAYNFHSYDGSNSLDLVDVGTSDHDNDATTALIFTPENLEKGSGADDVTQTIANDVNDSGTLFDLEGHDKTEFTQHVIGAQVQLGKIGLAINYGTSNTQNDAYDSRPVLATGADDTASIQALDYDASFVNFDAAYSLGSKARLIAAFKSTDNDAHPVTGEDSDVDEYYLLYRVDF